jgi:hypothetical protein
MPIRLFNWDRQAGILLDPSAAMSAGSKAGVGGVHAIDQIPNLLANLNNISIQWRVKNEFTQLQPSLDAAINNWADNNDTGMCYDPGDVGALVHAVTWQGDSPWGMPPPQGFVTMFLGDCGLDSHSVFNKYISTPMAFTGSPANTKQNWIFFWYTLDSTQQC